MNVPCGSKLVVTLSAAEDALDDRGILVEVVSNARLPAGYSGGAAHTRHCFPPLTLRGAVPAGAGSVQERPDRNAVKRRGEKQ